MQEQSQTPGKIPVIEVSTVDADIEVAPKQKEQAMPEQKKETTEKKKQNVQQTN